MRRKMISKTNVPAPAAMFYKIKTMQHSCLKTVKEVLNKASRQRDKSL
jgi:hypothetical protein